MRTLGKPRRIPWLGRLLGLDIIMVTLENVTQLLNGLEVDIDALIAKHPDPVDLQPLADKITALDGKVQAAVAAVNGPAA